MNEAFPEIRLRPGLDAEFYAREYEKHRFVQIPDIFEPELARAIEKMLTSLPWRLVYSDPDEGVVQLSAEDRQRLGPQGMAMRMQKVMDLATRNYGYCYNAYQMNEALKDARDPGHPIHKLTAFLNSEAFRTFGETVIGEAGITNTDAQATLYTRGSFLTRHIDDGARNERRCAYTLGFTENWMTDWGGLLLFLDKNTDVTSGHLPRFNVLTLFDGHRIHAVSPISAFAGKPRLSVAGWLRND
ncbi:MAG: proline hydroxylase [Ponticaulis sp.]|nr:proline hydroxylase [Ponticaulis sp.]